MSGCDLPLMIRLGVRLPNMFGMIIIINQDIRICSYQLYGVKKMVYHGIYQMVMIIWGLLDICWLGNPMAKSDSLDMHRRHQNRQETR